MLRYHIADKYRKEIRNPFPSIFVDIATGH